MDRKEGKTRPLWTSYPTVKFEKPVFSKRTDCSSDQVSSLLMVEITVSIDIMRTKIRAMIVKTPPYQLD